HMNNAAYLVLFEEARWELITKNGYGLNEVIKQQKGPVILDIEIRFKKEIKLREKIKITTELVSHERKISKFKQDMIKEDGTVAAELNLTFGFFDLQTRRLINPTPEWKKAIGLT
ncbi:MAG TPA: acyl-CoA thioesterase, partial [bacterium]|nr:acyl-CoA thioesterase [bacterium]